MATNMYRVGDYVYFEVSALAPYQIRRIEELNRTATGNVEARVMCFARRRDIDPALLHIADQENKPKEASNEKNEPLAENDCKDEPLKIDSDSKCAPAPDDLPTESTETEKSGDKMEIDDKSDAAAADAKIESNDMDEGKLNAETQESRDARAVSAPIAEKSTDNANEKNENGNEKSPSRAQSVPKEQKMEQGDSCEAKESDDKVKIDDGQDMPCAGVSAAKHKLPRPGHGGLPIGSETLGAPSIHRLRHRELYLLRQCETLPATHIRGKCTVTLLSEVERPDTFVRAEDSFYYSLVYDPTQKTLLADKGEIRVGDKYQAVIPPISGQYGTEGTKEYCLEEHEKLATCVFNPNAGLRSNEVDQFMILARSVGTLARALDSSSSVKMPGLHTSAVAASRDVTLLNALNLLHKANYDWGTAMRLLVPMVPTSSGGNTEKHSTDTGPSSNSQAGEFANANAPGSKRVLGPVLCRDQLEEWSAAEANLFEEAVEKCGKEFSEIRNDMLPWKCLRDIVEYYYMWKTTDRYVQQRRNKAAEAESRLKQVYIPSYNKPNPNLLAAAANVFCEGCRITHSVHWFAWGPAHVHRQMRLCGECWSYWKRYGGLVAPHEHDNYDNKAAQANTIGVGASLNAPAQLHANPPGIMPPRGVPGARHQFGAAAGVGAHPVHVNPNQGHHRVGGQAHQQSGGRQVLQQPAIGGGKQRMAIYLNTNWLTRIARRLAPSRLLDARKCARRPFTEIKHHVVKAHCQSCTPMQILAAAKQIKGGRLPQRLLHALQSAVRTHQQHQGPGHAGRQTMPVSMAPVVPQKRPPAQNLPSAEYPLPAKKLRQRLTPQRMKRMARAPVRLDGSATGLLPQVTAADMPTSAGKGVTAGGLPVRFVR